ncbi:MULTISPECIES: ABC transporter permease [Xanthomonas]|uniref:ABC transporter permease n=1 Tax=Xanthomonas TaxID=338 RepID=UPI000C851582|nr:ABC transporter permease [Xanthomonas arboricola]QDS16136.1 ABC transporter permease [Xanthomonas arboricola]SOU07148.1 ABC transporter permease [Xanthomonas arboricola pv. fragariae]
MAASVFLQRLRLQATILFIALRVSGLRSLLAIFAIAMGSAAVMMIMASSAGTQRRLQALTEVVGKNMFMVQTGRSSIARSGAVADAKLTLADADAIGYEVAGVQRVLPVLQRNSVVVKNTRKSFPTTVLGVTEQYFQARKWKLGEGRLIDDLDDRRMERVAVVGAGVARSVRAGGSLVGDMLIVAGVPFMVIGELREKGLGPDGKSEDTNVFVPLQTSLRRLYNVESLSHLLVQTRDWQQMPAVEAATAQILRRSRGMRANGEDNFEILGLVRQNEATRVSNALIGRIGQFLAATLLILGGVGIFTVTYFNVTQRKSEIGLRRALGAKKRDIAAMIATEACLLSVIGGCMGVALGALAVFVLGRWTEWPVSVQPAVVINPLLIAIAIGFVFGVLPALRASQLAPVEALRADGI